LAAGIIALGDLKTIIGPDIHVGGKDPCRPAGAGRRQTGDRQENKGDQTVPDEFCHRRNLFRD